MNENGTVVIQRPSTFSPKAEPERRWPQTYPPASDPIRINTTTVHSALLVKIRTQIQRRRSTEGNSGT